jgi:hypothetical protein
VAFVAALGLLGACGSAGDRPSNHDDSYAPMLDAARSETSSVDRCAEPGRQGCPCDQSGSVVECGKILVRAGDYITCSMGHSWCDGKTWSECFGDRVVTQSLSEISASDGGLVPLSE